jgi:hypothetical protein
LSPGGGPARLCSSTNSRIADDRLPYWRLDSIFATTLDSVALLLLAISFKPHQNGSSRLMLVLWPAITIDRFMTVDFIMCLSIAIGTDRQRTDATLLRAGSFS